MIKDGLDFARKAFVGEQAANLVVQGRGLEPGCQREQVGLGVALIGSGRFAHSGGTARIARQPAEDASGRVLIREQAAQLGGDLEALRRPAGLIPQVGDQDHVDPAALSEERLGLTQVHHRPGRSARGCHAAHDELPRRRSDKQLE